jgi:hypothetical protein
MLIGKFNLEKGNREAEQKEREANLEGVATI